MQLVVMAIDLLRQIVRGERALLSAKDRRKQRAATNKPPRIMNLPAFIGPVRRS